LSGGVARQAGKAACASAMAAATVAASASCTRADRPVAGLNTSAMRLPPATMLAADQVAEGGQAGAGARSWSVPPISVVSRLGQFALRRRSVDQAVALLLMKGGAKACIVSPP
jgi:hypothetical protein